MWLRYGIDIENKLVEVEDVASGKTNLRCPYCGGELVAKKGKVKQHHFSHSGETCNIVVKREQREVPHLPLYDAFNIYLTGKQLEQLKKLWHRCKSDNGGIDRLEVIPAFTQENLLELRQTINLGTGRKTYHFTALGLIPVGALPLTSFNPLHESLIEQKLTQLEAAIFTNSGSVLPQKELRVRLTDLRIYCAQMRKILLASLYYLKVQADGKILYKIGITTRTMSKRIAEINRDLRSHYQTVEVEVLNIWAHRGNVEKYFKYRYCDFNHPIGTLTEYFKFAEPQAVERDLHQMEAKVLSPVEQDILEGKQDLSLAALLADSQVAAGDIRVSDRMEAELKQAFLSKPSSQQVITALHQGCSLRDSAAMASVSVEVARKVLAVIQA
ncbi:GIY-YIG nuclease family protein [Aliterella atlantica]|uniref:Bacteriophage T5 Orf172 DNA-binding domain-containing protein n=1 Tax=Aliterella atlantica CENA595 TaxID=1618023 RepID=A0A0D8ZNE9_9CYAN|nr:GIY-YIG nuclease family protein [Aliterella atlantica]KJH70270.1 hypothetical protein UH38_19185 [Aliterella atlantica CENA595]